MFRYSNIICNALPVSVPDAMMSRVATRVALKFQRAEPGLRHIHFKKVGLYLQQNEKASTVENIVILVLPALQGATR